MLIVNEIEGPLPSSPRGGECHPDGFSPSWGVSGGLRFIPICLACKFHGG